MIKNQHKIEIFIHSVFKCDCICVCDSLAKLRTSCSGVHVILPHAPQKLIFPFTFSQKMQVLFEFFRLN